uniref:Uncharacterized protein n=1 Tax=Cacopsylla melanoneura TaxID=428564 RepID=A0A8D8XXZ4_9HEMI
MFTSRLRCDAFSRSSTRRRMSESTTSANGAPPAAGLPLEPKPTPDRPPPFCCRVSPLLVWNPFLKRFTSTTRAVEFRPPPPPLPPLLDKREDGGDRGRPDGGDVLDEIELEVKRDDLDDGEVKNPLEVVVVVEPLSPSSPRRLGLVGDCSAITLNRPPPVDVRPTRLDPCWSPPWPPTV